MATGDISYWNGTAYVPLKGADGAPGAAGANGTNGTTPVIIGTSTSSRTIAASGGFTFVTQAGMALGVGEYLLVFSVGSPANWMSGRLTSYSGTTLAILVDDSGGSGTFTDWTIVKAGRRGVQGPAGSGLGTNLTTTRDGTSVSVNSDTGTDVVIAAADGTNAGVMTAAQQTKLGGIATGADVTSTALPSALSGATAKSTPVDADTVPLSDSAASGALKALSWANLKATAKTYFDTLYAAVTHTHPSTAVTDFAEAVDDRVAVLIVAGANVTKTYDDVANTLTIAATGGGGGGATNLSTTRDATSVAVNSDTGTDITLAAADTTNAGVMASADKVKLNGIETGAQVASTANVGTAVAAATAKTTPVDADTLPLTDSAASSALKKLSLTNLKAFLKTYFDTLYAAVSHVHSGADLTSGTVGTARLGLGTADSTKYLRGDQTWATPAGGGSGLPEVYEWPYVGDGGGSVSTAAGASRAVIADQTITLPSGTWDLVVTGRYNVTQNTNSRPSSIAAALDGTLGGATSNPAASTFFANGAATFTGVASGSHTVRLVHRNDYTAAQTTIIQGAAMEVRAYKRA